MIPTRPSKPLIKTIQCPSCEGTGKNIDEPGDVVCEDCGGKKTITVERKEKKSFPWMRR